MTELELGILLSIIVTIVSILVIVALIWRLFLSIQGAVMAYDKVKDFLHRRKYGIHRNKEEYVSTFAFAECPACGHMEKEWTKGE